MPSIRSLLVATVAAAGLLGASASVDACPVRTSFSLAFSLSSGDSFCYDGRPSSLFVAYGYRPYWWDPCFTPRYSWYYRPGYWAYDPYCGPTYCAPAYCAPVAVCEPVYVPVCEPVYVAPCYPVRRYYVCEPCRPRSFLSFSFFDSGTYLSFSFGGSSSYRSSRYCDPYFVGPRPIFRGHDRPFRGEHGFAGGDRSRFDQQRDLPAAQPGLSRASFTGPVPNGAGAPASGGRSFAGGRAPTPISAPGQAGPSASPAKPSLTVAGAPSPASPAASKPATPSGPSGKPAPMIAPGRKPAPDFKPSGAKPVAETKPTPVSGPAVKPVPQIQPGANPATKPAASPQAPQGPQTKPTPAAPTRRMMAPESKPVQGPSPSPVVTKPQAPSVGPTPAKPTVPAFSPQSGGQNPGTKFPATTPGRPLAPQGVPTAKPTPVGDSGKPMVTPMVTPTRPIAPSAVKPPQYAVPRGQVPSQVVPRFDIPKAPIAPPTVQQRVPFTRPDVPQSKPGMMPASRPTMQPSVPQQRTPRVLPGSGPDGGSRMRDGGPKR